MIGLTCFLVGLYIASGSRTGELCVWDVSTSTARVVATASSVTLLSETGESGGDPPAASGIAWRPGSNQLVVVDEGGRIGVWEDPVPATLPVSGCWLVVDGWWLKMVA